MAWSEKWVIKKKKTSNNNIDDFYINYVKYISENPPEIIEKTMKFKQPENKD